MTSHAAESKMAGLLTQPGGATPNVDGLIIRRADPSVSYTPWLSLPPIDQLRASLADGVARTIERYAQGAAGIAATRSNAYDASRAGWQAICPIRSDSVVVDFGCGLGAVSRSLARNVGTVVGIDACYERLMINAAINREEGVHNVEVVFGDHRTLGEIQPASVDGLVLNGVLEWVPEYVEGEPYDVQRSFLAACRRILKPDGWLYIGIENRWGFRYFTGRRDEHTGLLGSSLLPRVLANLYSRALRGRPYRTLTHGPNALTSILVEAGFASVHRFSPVPDYRHFEILAPLDRDPRRARVAGHLGVFKPWKQRIVERPAFFTRLAPSLAYVAHAGGGQRPPWLADVAASVTHVYVKHDQASVWFGDREPQVRDVALSAGASAKLDRMDRLGRALAEHPACPAALQAFTVHRHGTQLWADRTFVPGRVLDSVPVSERTAQYGAVQERLRQIHALGLVLPGPPMTLADVFRDWAPNAPVQLGRWHERVTGLVRQIERGILPRSILMHGDCSAKNIVLAATGPELIDWEWSRLVNFPAYDVLKLAWHDLEDPSKPDLVARPVDRYLEDERACTWLERVHPGTDWKIAVLSYWTLRLGRRISRFQFGELPADVLQNEIAPTVESMERLISVR